MENELLPGTPAYFEWVFAQDYLKDEQCKLPEFAHQEADKRIKAAMIKGDGKLDLRGLNLTHIPEHICDIDNLSVLLIDRFYGCRLAFEIPTGRTLQCLTHLTLLHMYRCCLTEMGFVSTMVNLQFLCLYFNDIHTIEGLDRLSQLQSLDLTRNHITDIPALGNLQQLQSLYLAENSISTIQNLAPLTSIKHLDLNANALTHLSGIDKLDQLEVLDLSDMHLHELDFQRLPQLQFETFKQLICHETRIDNIPTVLLSEDHEDNCLSRVKDYLLALNQGEQAINEVSLMVLGNGQIGKTQLCRRLCGEVYDSNEASTHGVLIKRASLPIAGGTDISLNIWDFGGQELYHGTHRLFFNSRNTVFLLLWLPEAENSQSHCVEGMTFKNHRLEYWFEHIRQCAGKNAKVIVAQAQCDDLNQYTNILPVNVDWDTHFSFARMVATSAKSDDGLEVLLPVLKQAVKANIRDLSQQRMPKAWVRVKEQLHQWLIENNDRVCEQKKHRLFTQQQFIELCINADDPNLTIPQDSVDTLLHLLHHTGVVFYQADLFDGQILLDQSWCLNAIYGVFHRDNVMHRITQNCGLFRADDMGFWLWNEQGHSQSDQQEFINMMLSCGVCFVISDANTPNSERQYCVPELLPISTDRYVFGALARNWDALCTPIFEQSFEVDVLHQALFNQIMAMIAEQVREGGIYWQDGLLAYSTDDKTWLMFERIMTNDVQGKLTFKTRGEGAQALLTKVIEWVQWDQVDWRVKLDLCEADIENTDPQTAANLPPKFDKRQPQLCVSYRWRSQDIAIIDEFCQQASSKGIKVLRDTEDLKMGESISSFMKKIGRGKRIIVVLSDDYLKSSYCMFELFEIWRNSCSEGQDFINRIKVYRMADSSIDTPIERIKHAAYWKKQYQQLDAAIDEYGKDILGVEDFIEFKRIQEFYLKIGDILSFISDTLYPSDVSDLVEFGLAGLELSPQD